MGKPRVFSTAALSAMQDPELTGLDWRVYLWVSLHDGMSLLKGKGGGCYASNLTLFAKAQCDYAAGCRSLSKLVDRGHLVREKKGRTTAYRVTFPAPDMLQAGNLSARQHVADTQDEEAGYVAEQVRQEPDKPSEPPQDYIPLSEELDSVETGKLNSSEEAHLGDAQCHSDWIEGAFDAASLGVNLKADRGKEMPEGGLGRELVLAAHLPRNFAKLPLGAQVARIDQAYTAIGRDPDRLDSRERDQLSEWLWTVFDEHMGGELDATAQQAGRLREELHAW